MLRLGLGLGLGLHRGAGKKDVVVFSFSGTSTEGAVGELRLKSAEDINLQTDPEDDITLSLDDVTYSDSVELTADTQTTVYVKMNVANGTGTITTKKGVIDNLGSHTGSGDPSNGQSVWRASTGTIPECTINLQHVSKNCLYVVAYDNTTLIGAMPSGCLKILLYSINWTYEGALPAGLTYLYILGHSTYWTYEGALPAGLTHLYLYGRNINWTYEGALPAGLTFLYLYGHNINWTYEGALPVNLRYIWLLSDKIYWTYHGALPIGVYYIFINSASVNWTWDANPISPPASYPLPDGGSLSFLELVNYRTSGNKVTGEELKRLLIGAAGRTNDITASTFLINEYDDSTPPIADIVAAEPDENGTLAEQIKYWINEVYTNKMGGTGTIQLNGTEVQE